MKTLLAFVSGSLFGLGLLIGGMTNPDKVRAFLDVSGVWDPSLGLVMFGALLVFFPAYRWVDRRGAPRVGLPVRTDVDARLIVGAIMFGIGWGLAGYCPGPAIVATGSFVWSASITLAVMLAGIAGVGLWERRT